MKVVILHDRTSEGVLLQVERWLEGRRCVTTLVEVEGSAERKANRPIVDKLVDCDVIILMFGPKLSAADVQATLLVAKAKGIKIVGVHSSENPTLDQSVDAFEKYAFALVPVDEGKLIAAVCGEVPEWTDEEGEPREEPETDRHKCKKRKPDAAA